MTREAALNAVWRAWTLYQSACSSYGRADVEPYLSDYWKAVKAVPAATK